jgi:predicted N-acyltransferase
VRGKTLKVHSEIAEIRREQWDALMNNAATPFVSWTFLEALEHSGCVGSKAHWWPRHLTMWRGDELIAAAPAYVKVDSRGDFSRDWGWHDLARRFGFRYYPKLVLAVPFSPVTGGRILVADGEDRQHCTEALMHLARTQAREEGIHSINALYCLESEVPFFESQGLAPRTLIQFHWRNRGYSSPDEWIMSLPTKRRTQARRERREPEKQGISIRTIRGDEIASNGTDIVSRVYPLYERNCHRFFWGQPYLNQDFFERIVDGMPENVEVVEATKDGREIAMAFNVSSDTHLFGRYWGCYEEHRFLHFNVCLYHSIDRCIERGLQVFEGGAGGEHKMWRGFDPALVYSVHTFLDPQMNAVIHRVCEQETASRTEQLEQWRRDHGLI